MQAIMDASHAGKVDFTPEAQMHLDIIESTAKVHHVTKEVQQRWGNQYRIVTADGLELEDCECTQGKSKSALLYFIIHCIVCQYVMEC